MNEYSKTTRTVTTLGRAALAAGCLVVAAAGCSSADEGATASSVESPAIAAFSLRVVGNHLVDGAGNVVTLHGVNHSGQEFECIQGGTPTSRGWGLFDGPTDVTMAKAIAAWNANVVRIPLNEDCWLGINGVNPTHGGAAYQTAIQSFVNNLHQAGLYVILDLHWNAPAGFPSAAQQPLPDADHATDFWRSVATVFRADPAVIFDLYNEPFLYGSYVQTAGQDSWACWLNGCGLNQFLTGGTPYTQSYAWKSVGMQSLVDTVRATGATQPIMVSGLDWANDMSGWLAHKPNDPLKGLVASWHSYPGQPCATTTCWTNVIQPLAAQVPIVVGETGDSVSSPVTYINRFLPWADSHGVSYLGWAWNTWGDPANILIRDYKGTPTTNYGQAFHDHLMSLPKTTPAPAPAPTPAPTPTPAPAPAPTPGDIQISSALHLSATTVSLGTVTASVTYKNVGGTAVTLQNIVIAGRPPGGTHTGGPYDDFAPLLGTTTIQPGQSVTLNASRTFGTGTPTGSWYAFPTYRDAAGVWHDGSNLPFTVQ